MRIHLASDTLRKSVRPRDEIGPDRVNVRVFLAAYMIAAKPSHVFESMQQLEKAVEEAAKLVLSNFESIIHFTLQRGSLHGIEHGVLAGFSVLLCNFLRCFKAWKVPDEEKLVKRIKHALIALYQAEAVLPVDQPVDSEISIEFRDQIERLRGKLISIGGPEALAEFDRTRPATVAGIERGVGRVSWPEKTTNEQLAHELLLDSTFQLGDDGEHTVIDTSSREIRGHFHEVWFCIYYRLLFVWVSYCFSPLQQFWESVADDLRLSVPCYVRVFRVLRDIKDALCELAGGREVSATMELLDVDFIKRQLKNGAFSLEDCKRLFVSVVGIIRRIQAPKRDAEVNDKWKLLSDDMILGGGDQPKAFQVALRFMHDQINLLRIDAANARCVCVFLWREGVELVLMLSFV